MDLSSCGLTHKILPKIFPIIAKNPTLRYLKLDQNNFAKDNFASIKEALRYNVGLKYLSLSMCKIDDQGAKTLGEAFSIAQHI